MARSSTILAVWNALPEHPIPLRDLADAAKLEKNTVRDCLTLLIHLGLAERIHHEKAIASDRKGGWVRVEYRAIAAKTTVIDMNTIDTTTIESKE
jgi:predicted transcriptional regulator